MKKPEVIVTGTRDGVERAAQEAVEPKIHAAVGTATGARGRAQVDLHEAVKELAEAMVKEGVELHSPEAIARARAVRAKFRRKAGQRTHGAGAYPCETEEQMATYRLSLQAREHQSRGRVKANDESRAAAVERRELWQDCTDAIRKQDPARSRKDIAKDIAAEYGGSPEVIYRAIR
jgi:hypothetical protein